VRAAPFPLRTAFVAKELEQDIKDFLRALVSSPIHNWDSAINQLFGPEDFRSEDKYHEIRATIIGEIAKMTAIGDGLQVDAEPVSLSHTVRTVCTLFAMTHPFFDTKSIDEPVDRTEEFKVHAQKEILETVVRALFSNATRIVFRRIATDGEGYVPMVRYELRRDSHRVILSVIDNGGGVLPSVQDRLFDPFNKGESDGGHGLALFYAAAVAEAWEGRLVLSRNEVTETQFDLILPAFEEAEYESSNAGGE
jgi:signal transduction histidine kinase